MIPVFYDMNRKPSFLAAWLLPLAALLAFSFSSCTPDVKKASDYGFLPENDPMENAMNFQRCLDGGGHVVVDVPGTYRLCRTMLLDSGTTLELMEGVTVQRERDDEGVAARHVFLNRGALTRSWDHDITIRGLHISVNGIDGGSDIEEIVGLRGHLAFFYARNVEVEDFCLLDLEPGCFAVQVCTFENFAIRNVHIEGMKDAVHFGPGKGFVVQHGVFRTYDDPIALNAHDYTNSNPEMGWISDGVVEDCVDMEDEEHGTTGFFARVISGAWTSWREGMEIQSTGDAVVSDGRIYRSNGKVEPRTYVSTCQPTHLKGTVLYPDGITWTMSQDQNVDFSCGVRNVTFRDIRLEKKRPVALSLHFDSDMWSRSYYPGAVLPVEDDIVFEGLEVKAEIPVLLDARTPVGKFAVRNSDIGQSRINLRVLDTEGMRYDTTRIVIDNVRSSVLDSLILSTSRPYVVLDH